MPTVKFKMLPPPKVDAESAPALFKCRSCKEEMELSTIDGHAKVRHNATSVMVDTTTLRDK